MIKSISGGGHPGAAGSSGGMGAVGSLPCPWQGPGGLEGGRRIGPVGAPEAPRSADPQPVPDALPRLLLFAQQRVSDEG